MNSAKSDKHTLFELLKRNRSGTFLVFMASIFAVMSLPQVQRFTFFRDLSDATISLMFRIRGIQEAQPGEIPIVLVALDDPSLNTELSAGDLEINPDAAYTQEGWPWNRAVHGRLIERLIDAGARVVGFDFIFPTPNDGDLEFYDALEKHRDKVVIGFDYSPYENELGETRVEERLPYDDLLPFDGPLDTIGFVNVRRDEDGTLRRAKLSTNIYVENQVFIDDQEQFDRISKLALREDRELAFAARIAAKVDPRIIEGLPGFFDMPLINYGGPASYFPAISYLDILLDDRFANFREMIDGSIVVVGPYADLFKDVLPTPFGDMFGVETHAHVLRSLLNDSFYTKTSRTTGTAVNALLALPVLAIGLGIRSAYLKLALGTLLGLTFVISVQLIFEHALIISPVVSPLAIILIGGGTLTAYDFILEQFDRNRLKGYLSRYVSPDVANILANNQNEFKALLEGTNRPMTILFSDIRGFTTLSERYTPKGLVEHLNEYFDGMVSEILRTRGSLNKYIGDAILAVWGDIYSEGEQQDCLRALRCAINMKTIMTDLNKGWEGIEGRLPLSIGIGISQGEGFIGNMGHPGRMEVAVMGDVVNLGSRLEGATKQYKTEILVSESVYDLCKESIRFQELDVIQVKGKTQGVKVFAPINEMAEAAPDWYEPWNQALNTYRSQDFVEAKRRFEALVTDYPEIAGGAELYVERSVELQNDPPPENWDFVFVMKTK